MANIIEPRAGRRSDSGSSDVKFYDEGDGSYTQANTGYLRIWDPTNLVWVKGLADASGNLRVSPGSATASTGLLFAKIDTASSGDNTIVAASALNKIKVVSYGVVTTLACNVTWKSGAGTTLSGAMPFAANGGLAAFGTPGAHLFETAVNTALVLNLSANTQVSGHVSYFAEP